MLLSSPSPHRRVMLRHQSDWMSRSCDEDDRSLNNYLCVPDSPSQLSVGRTVSPCSSSEMQAATGLAQMRQQSLQRQARSMSLEVPKFPEIRQLRNFRYSKLRRNEHMQSSQQRASIDSQTEADARLVGSSACNSPTSASKRFSIADALSDSFKSISLIRRTSSPMSRRARKMKKSRLVRKNGTCNVYCTNVLKRERQFLRDIFTTLIDVKWRWILVTFVIVFLISWTAFASFYFLICFVHGDLSVPKGEHNNPCIAQIDSFFSAFLFSVETQHTIGYGVRHVTTQCIPAGVTVCMQCVCGLLCQSFMVGLVFAKLARPSKRAQTLIFSEKAVISLRDGNLCLLMRVGDMRQTHLVEAHVRLIFITPRTTAEGEVEPLHQFELDVGYDTGSDRVFMSWPITVCHVITCKSPLYEYSQRSLPVAQFELVVLLEGIVESTGMTAQAKTSYLPCEILWGHRLAKLVTYQKFNGSYEIDYGLFQNTYAVKTPSCSAKEFDRLRLSSLPGGVSCSEAFYCSDESEARLQELRSFECTPLPSPMASRASTPPSERDSSERVQIIPPASNPVVNLPVSVIGRQSTAPAPATSTKRLYRQTSVNTTPPAIVVDSPTSPEEPGASDWRRTYSTRSCNAAVVEPTWARQNGSLSHDHSPDSTLSELDEECVASV